MLRFQIALAIILVGCVAFVACERGQQMLDPVDMTDTGDAKPMDMVLDMIKMDTHKSWMSVMLPAPMPMADATSPAETGAAHNPAHATTGITTARTFYINDIGVMANKEGTMYPAGTVIVKEIMDDTNMFVDKVAVMIKSDDAMYAGHNGWVSKNTLVPVQMLNICRSEGLTLKMQVTAATAATPKPQTTVSLCH